MTGEQEEEEVTTGFNLLRTRLEEERRHLTEQLDQLEADACPTEVRREGSPFGKREEEASETLELEKRLAMGKKLSDTLARIEHTLQKYEAGTYGLCDSCGQVIEQERLEALPQASLCLKCKAHETNEAKGAR